MAAGAWAGDSHVLTDLAWRPREDTAENRSWRAVKEVGKAGHGWPMTGMGNDARLQSVPVEWAAGRTVDSKPVEWAAGRTVDSKHPPAIVAASVIFLRRSKPLRIFTACVPYFRTLDAA